MNNACKICLAVGSLWEASDFIDGSEVSRDPGATRGERRYYLVMARWFGIGGGWGSHKRRYGRRGKVEERTRTARRKLKTSLLKRSCKKLL